jgi:hypothetical protein
MNKIKASAGPEWPEILRESFGRQRHLERDQPFETKHGVIQIAATGTIAKPAIRVLLGKEELPDQLCAVVEQFRGKSSHLQHFQSRAHRADVL